MASPHLNFRIPQEAMDRLEQKAAGLELSATEAARRVVLDWIGSGSAEEPMAEPPERSGKELSEEDKVRIRGIRDRRQRVAAEHGIAIGWVNADGTVQPGAPKMPEKAKT